MTAEQIRDINFRLALSVRRDPGIRALLTTPEQLIVALALNRADWLGEMGYTIAAAIDRLGWRVVREVREIERTLSAIRPEPRPDPAELRGELHDMFDRALGQDHPP